MARRQAAGQDVVQPRNTGADTSNVCELSSNFHDLTRFLGSRSKCRTAIKALAYVTVYDATFGLNVVFVTITLRLPIASWRTKLKAGKPIGCRAHMNRDRLKIVGLDLNFTRIKKADVPHSRKGKHYTIVAE